jgi:hypothetical protein
MTEHSTVPLAPYDAEYMRAIEAGLAACGLTTHLTDARAGLDLTATLSPSRAREAEFWIDDAGYAELRFWIVPGTPPTEITATALRALQAVTARPPDPVCGPREPRYPAAWPPTRPGGQ